MSESTAMTALLGSVIDYAGIFPPASLSLDDTLKKAATFRRTAQFPWLMSKVALPLVDIKKITTQKLFESGADGSPWLYTALGSLQTQTSEWIRSVEFELRECSRFNSRGASSAIRQTILSYETRIPPQTFESGITVVLHTLLQTIQDLSGAAVQPIFEIPKEAVLDSSYLSSFESFSDWVAEQENPAFVPCIKVRTGGSGAISVKELATFIKEITFRGFRFKLTQGLHEAFSRNSSLGFVNVFTAISLAHTLGTDEFSDGAIEECLLASNIDLLKDKIKWGKFEVSVEEIEQARRRHGTTFGSCTLDEPNESLKGIKL